MNGKNNSKFRWVEEKGSNGKGKGKGKYKGSSVYSRLVCQLAEFEIVWTINVRRVLRQ